MKSFAPPRMRSPPEVTFRLGATILALPLCTTEPFTAPSVALAAEIVPAVWAIPPLVAVSVAPLVAVTLPSRVNPVLAKAMLVPLRPCTVAIWLLLLVAESWPPALAVSELAWSPKLLTVMSPAALRVTSPAGFMNCRFSASPFSRTVPGARTTVGVAAPKLLLPIRSRLAPVKTDALASTRPVPLCTMSPLPRRVTSLAEIVPAVCEIPPPLATRLTERSPSLLALTSPATVKLPALETRTSP